MFAKIVLVFVALMAFAAAFAPAARMASRTARFQSECDEYKRDKKGKCPGDTGYVSFVKDNVPKDFATYAAELKAAKSVTSAQGRDCDEYKRDKKGKCPGDTGYVSFVKDNVPKDFATYQAELKAAAAAKK